MPVPAQFEIGANRFHGSLCFHLPDLTVGTGDVLTDFVMGFPGYVARTWLVVTTAITSAGTANVAFNLEINSVNLTGGVVTISANSAAGTFISGTVITGGQHFDANDTMSLELTETVAPTGGTVMFVIEYEGKITQG